MLNNNPQCIYDFDKYVQLHQTDVQDIHKFVKESLAATQETMTSLQSQRATTADIVVRNSCQQSAQLSLKTRRQIRGSLSTPKEVAWQQIESFSSEDNERKINPC